MITACCLLGIPNFSSLSGMSLVHTSLCIREWIKRKGKMGCGNIRHHNYWVLTTCQAPWRALYVCCLRLSSSKLYKVSVTISVYTWRNQVSASSDVPELIWSECKAGTHSPCLPTLCRESPHLSPALTFGWKEMWTWRMALCTVAVESSLPYLQAALAVWRATRL